MHLWWYISARITVVANCALKTPLNPEEIPPKKQCKSMNYFLKKERAFKVKSR